jgi:hypothetical protein
MKEIFWTIIINEIRSQIVTPPVSYSEDPRFISRPGDQLSGLIFFAVVLRSLKRNAGVAF